MTHLIIAGLLLGIHAMNVELDAADAAMRADPVPSTQAALDARTTVCDRASACDLFGCDPECDSFVGKPAVPDALALNDADPPQASLTVCTGSLPATSLLSNHDGACHDYEVGATAKLAADLLNHNDDDTFRHVYWRGGDPACVFTATVRYPNPDDPSWRRTRTLSNIAGGRDCNAQTRDAQCAYIAQGYSILAVAGQGCSQAGVPLCTGPFCT